MWVDAWELSSTHPGYTSTTTATYIKIHSIRCTEWYEVKFMAARPNGHQDLMATRGGTGSFAASTHTIQYPAQVYVVVLT